MTGEGGVGGINTSATDGSLPPVVDGVEGTDAAELVGVDAFGGEALAPADACDVPSVVPEEAGALGVAGVLAGADAHGGVTGGIGAHGAITTVTGEAGAGTVGAGTDTDCGTGGAEPGTVEGGALGADAVVVGADEPPADALGVDVPGALDVGALGEPVDVDAPEADAEGADAVELEPPTAPPAVPAEGDVVAPDDDEPAACADCAPPAEAARRAASAAFCNVSSDCADACAPADDEPFVDWLQPGTG